MTSHYFSRKRHQQGGTQDEETQLPSVTKQETLTQTQNRKNKRKLSYKMKCKLVALQEVLKKLKYVTWKQKSCRKHMKKLEPYDDEYMMTVNELYEDCTTFLDERKSTDEHIYSSIDEQVIYDDPMGSVILDVFEAEDSVQVRRLVHVIKRKSGELKEEQNNIVKQIESIIFTDELENSYEDIDSLYHEYDIIDHIYDYIDPSKLENLKSAKIETMEIQHKQKDVKEILTTLSANCDKDMISLEDIYRYAIPQKRNKQGKKEKKPLDSLYQVASFNIPNQSSYNENHVRKALEKEFGFETNVNVKRLVAFFEDHEKNLQKQRFKAVTSMADILVEEIVENDVYEAFTDQWKNEILDETSEVKLEKSKRNGAPKGMVPLDKDELSPNENVTCCKNINRPTDERKAHAGNRKYMTKSEFMSKIQNEPTEEMKQVMIERFGHDGKLSVKELIEMFNLFIDHDVPVNANDLKEMDDISKHLQNSKRNPRLMLTEKNTQRKALSNRKSETVITVENDLYE